MKTRLTFCAPFRNAFKLSMRNIFRAVPLRTAFAGMPAGTVRIRMPEAASFPEPSGNEC